MICTADSVVSYSCMGRASSVLKSFVFIVFSFQSQPALIRPPTSQPSSSSSSPSSSVHNGTSGSSSIAPCGEPAEKVFSKHVAPTAETLSKETKSKGNDDIVENSTSGTVKLNLCQPNGEPSPKHSGVGLDSPSSSVSGDPFPDSKNWSSFDDEFIKDVAQELDRWESDTYLPQEEKHQQQQCETHLHQQAGTYSLHNNKDRCLDSVKAPSSAAPTLSPSPTFSVCVSSTTDKAFSSCFTSSGHTAAVNTPSRAQYISHVAPMTLLQASSSLNHSTGVQTIFRPSLCCSVGNIKYGCGVAGTGTPIVRTSDQTCNTIPSYNKASPSINGLFSPTIQLKTPSPGANPQHSTNKQSRQSVQRPCKLLGNYSELKTPSPCSTGKEFHTPSTAEWMKVKMHNHTPLTSSSSREPLMTLNGGKVTPPLCNCGKRAKRKLVTNPGPNEGKPFYVCPQGRGSDCGYFRWECSSPCGTSPHEGRITRSPSSFLGQSPDILSSEYTD